MRVYLCGPIANCTDDEANNWRDIVKKKLISWECVDPMRRDYRGRETGRASEIVNSDLNDIDSCDIVLANCWKPGWGTPMEIMYAWMTGKPVVAVAPDGYVSPWVSYHAEKVYSSVEDAVKDVEDGVYG